MNTANEVNDNIVTLNHLGMTLLRLSGLSEARVQLVSDIMMFQGWEAALHRHAPGTEAQRATAASGARLAHDACLTLCQELETLISSPGPARPGSPEWNQTLDDIHRLLCQRWPDTWLRRDQIRKTAHRLTTPTRKE